MPRIVLITNPSHDDATKYLNAWSEGILSNILSTLVGTDIFELKNSDVTKANLTRLVQEKNPHLILFHGHGGGRMILGFESNILVVCGDNEQLLNDRIIHSLSCDSGKELGPKCISIGTKAYIGYKEEFKFAHQGFNTNNDRFNDPTARIFLEPAFEVNKALLEGESVNTAYLRSQKIYADNLVQLMLSPSPILNTTYTGMVYHNMIHQVPLGDQSSSF